MEARGAFEITHWRGENNFQLCVVSSLNDIFVRILASRVGYVLVRHRGSGRPRCPTFFNLKLLGRLAYM